MACPDGFPSCLGEKHPNLKTGQDLDPDKILYKLQLVQISFTGCNLYKQFIQVAICTLSQVDLYKLQHV